MTGFVFTFSLFCTAVFNTDPAVLQRAELTAVRQMIEAVIPEARLQRVFRNRQSQCPISTIIPASPRTSSLRSQSCCDGNTVSFIPASRRMSARPIRAPSAV
ncbi:MAG: hypothetical protein WC824_01745 [Bacteroidota bacterium]|jgi:hypothetical protein